MSPSCSTVVVVNIMIVVVVGIIVVVVVPMARVLVRFPKEGCDLLMVQVFSVPIRVFDSVVFVSGIIIYYTP